MGHSNNLFGQIIVGTAVVILIVPWGIKSMSRRHVDLNGIALDFAETVMETVTRKDINFGDMDRRDYPNPGD